MPSTSADGFQDGLKIERTALFLDVDGTLLDLAPRPGAVFVPPSLIDSLARADEALGGALALVSGRPIDDLDRLFSPLQLRASGVHGAQTRFSPNDPKEADEEAEGLPRKLWMALTEVLFDFPGTFAENKRYSFAVHYRTVPMLKQRLREALQSLIACACRPAPRHDPWPQRLRNQAARLRQGQGDQSASSPASPFSAESRFSSATT